MAKQQEEVLQQDEINSKRMRTSNFVEIEEYLNNWFSDCKSKQLVTIDGSCIKENAIKIASLVNVENFKTSSHLLQKFNKRHNISLVKNNREEGLLGTFEAKNYQLNVLPGLIAAHHPNGIYNADETYIIFLY